MHFIGKKNTDWKNIPDEELLERYRSENDSAVFAEIFCRYTTLVYGVCKKYLEDPEDSRDAVMQIFSKLSDQLKHEQPEKFRPWLYTVSKNYCLMELRKTKNFQFVAEKHESLMENEEVTHPEEEEIIQKKLEQAQHDLPEMQRICVHLFYIEEKSYREISAQTGYSLNEVKSYIQNGKRNIKIRLEKGGYP